MKKRLSALLLIFFFSGIIPLFSETREDPDSTVQQEQEQEAREIREYIREKKDAEKKKKKDKIFLMGLAMLRLNWTGVKGDEARFRYSDMGLPADFSTRERVSLMVDGTFGDGEYSIDGHLNYDPENRITEPPLDFFIRIGNDDRHLSVGDFRTGVFLDSVFSRFQHPFRGALLGTRSKRFGAELVGGVERGESGIDLLPADSGAGPYYMSEAPILRGSEVLYLVVKNPVNESVEIKRTLMERGRDYYIDYDRGGITFNHSIYPYDELGNPVFLEISFQYESLIGKFTRNLLGIRAFFIPFHSLKVSFSYLADMERGIDFAEAVKNRRGIFTLGVNVDSKPLSLMGELSFSENGSDENNTGFFGGGTLNISRNLRFFFNSWSIEEGFPTFANKQMQYGFSLIQIFPHFSEKNIFLSPFQFTRNLGTELFPFNLAQLSLNEKEAHGFFEWKKKETMVSLGYGQQQDISGDMKSDTMYVSSFHNGMKTKAWGRFALIHDRDQPGETIDSKTSDILLGLRQRVSKLKKGEVYAQADYNGKYFNDQLNVSPETFQQSYSLFAEYVTGREGFFAGYHKETLENRESGETTMDVDVLELGVRNHIYKWLFLDTRLRSETGTRDSNDVNNRIISFGLGLESRKFRALGRYEIQKNKTGENGGERTLWSLFLYGSPVPRMTLSLRYYNQSGREEVPLSVQERSEEQLNFRIMWRPLHFLSLFSHWRYDTNIDLYPPVDRTKSNSQATLQGLKLNITKKMDFLFNHKLIKVWGPIENHRVSYTAELGYLVFKNFRLGLGIEKIDYTDRNEPGENYDSTIGYLKLVAVF